MTAVEFQDNLGRLQRINSTNTKRGIEKWLEDFLISHNICSSSEVARKYIVIGVCVFFVLSTYLMVKTFPKDMFPSSIVVKPHPLTEEEKSKASEGFLRNYEKTKRQ